MNLPPDVVKNGFSLCDVNATDVHDFVRITRLCLKKYIDEDNNSFGEWNDDNVVNDFKDKMNRTFFQKLLLHDEVVGFMAYDVKEDKIDGISMNLIEKARNHGIGSAYLSHITQLSKAQDKPVFLYVMKSNPAQYLYERFGFKKNETREAFYLDAVYMDAVYLMEYNP